MNNELHSMLENDKCYSQKKKSHEFWDGAS